MCLRFVLLISKRSRVSFFYLPCAVRCFSPASGFGSEATPAFGLLVLRSRSAIQCAVLLCFADYPLGSEATYDGVEKQQNVYIDTNPFDDTVLFC